MEQQVVYFGWIGLSDSFWHLLGRKEIYGVNIFFDFMELIVSDLKTNIFITFVT